MVTGVAGQLGSDVIKEANSRGYRLSGLSLTLQFTGRSGLLSYVFLTKVSEDF